MEWSIVEYKKYHLEKQALEQDLLEVWHKIQKMVESPVVEMEGAYALIQRKNIVQKELEELALLTNWDYPAA